MFMSTLRPDKKNHIGGVSLILKGHEMSHREQTKHQGPPSAPPTCQVSAPLVADDDVGRVDSAASAPRRSACAGGRRREAPGKAPAVELHGGLGEISHEVGLP